jgi:Do/DeqQ family serine protease
MRLVNPSPLVAAAAALAFGVFATPAFAQVDRVVPESRAGVTQSFAPVVQRTAPAVVNVYSSVTVHRSNCPYPAGTVWAQAYCGQNAKAKDEKVDNSLGSGVIVSADGVIVTNNHVVAEGTEFRVALNDRREFPATLVMADKRSDLAVLKIDTKGEKLPTLDYADTRGIQIGDLVLAIGNPFGVGQSVTSGIVSGLARTDVNVSDISSFIQTDASINPGNSGGALVDMQGRLLGVNSMIFSQGGGSNGIGFAIPAEMVKRVVDAAVNGGTLVRPWLGAKGDGVTSKNAAALGLDRPRGVLLSEIYPGGPAEKAGLKKDDVVLSIDGRDVFDEKSMKFVAATKPAGESVSVSVLRAGKSIQISMRLTAPPGVTKMDPKVLQGVNPFDGAEVLEVSPALAEEQGLDPFKSGVVVNRVARGSTAARFVRPGDFVRELNGSTIKTVKDLDAALDKIAKSKQPEWRMALERNGERIERTVTP